MPAHRRSTIVLALLSFLFILPTHLHAQASSPKMLHAAELRLALKKLTVLGSVLYVAAHPDDENTAFLTSMTKGRLMRTAYLAVTRGEGGQNLIGSEQGDLMGVIRTQELLAARRIDGAEQFFTRAIDFGYSKTSEETMRIWGKERILSDVVWIIRKFRPDVIVTRFTPTLGGHGNHTSSAALAAEAFEAAGDANRFPEQLASVRPWKPKRLVWNVFRFQQSDWPTRPENSVALDLGAYSPLLGESFTEIAGRSRSMHKSQGFGAGQNRGEFINYFQHVAGDSARSDLFDGINTSWSRISGGEALGKTLEDAHNKYDAEHPANLIPILFRAYDQMSKLPSDAWVEVKKRELIDVLKSCAGLWVDALASDYSAVPGGELRITTVVLNRSDYPFTVEKISLPLGSRDTLVNARLAFNQPIQAAFSYRLPVDRSTTQPYWLREPHALGAYRVAGQDVIGTPENLPALSVKIALASPDGRLEVETPVRFRSVDPVEGEQYRPLEVIPPIALNLLEKVHVFTKQEEKSILVSVRSGGPNISGSVSLRVPEGWRVKPEAIPFNFAAKNEQLAASFSVGPTRGAVPGDFTVVATVGNAILTQGLTTIHYAHIPPQTVFPQAEGKLLRIDAIGKRRNIGYIMGSGDEIPVDLRELGYSVTLISDEDLANGSLSNYDVIIAGVRAYNTRPQLKTNQKKLMDFIESGGTYIVQYVTRQRLEAENLGPFPFNVSNDRVSVEEAPVRFVSPDHALLNRPNKITSEDFEGWVQERGLYFADKWDQRYTSVLASNDPGEQSKEGGLLVARYGKGYYVYTGYAFFRQLPAGVPGAYRLFVNLISLGR